MAANFCRFRMRLKLCMARSRRRRGRCEFSTLLLSHLPVSCFSLAPIARRRSCSWQIDRSRLPPFDSSNSPSFSFCSSSFGYPENLKNCARLGVPVLRIVFPSMQQSRLLVVVCASLLATPAQAYVDPGSGSVIVTTVLGLIAAIGCTFRKMFHNLRAKVFRKGSSVEERSLDD